MHRFLVSLLLLLFPLVGCPSTDPVDDDDTTEEEIEDDEHEHGTGELDTHLHAIHAWGDTEELALGTHEGMFRTEAGSAELVPVFEGPDFMGLVHDPFNSDRYWGSGHWSSNGLNNWGFAESIDRGVTWTEISLTGQADFHTMAVSAEQEDFVIGGWAGSFWISEDAGRTWDEQSAPASVSDIEVEDPAGPVLLVATGAALQRYTLPDGTSEDILAEAATAIDRAEDGWLVGLSDGDLLVCDPAFVACEPWDGPGAGAIVHLLADEDPAHMTVLTATAQVHHTEDSGATWELVVEGE